MSRMLGLNYPRLRLSTVFFYILVFLMPIQTRKIFFTDLSFYNGFHGFYNTIFLYLTDLLIFGLIIAWIWKNLPHSTFDEPSFSHENSNSPNPLFNQRGDKVQEGKREFFKTVIKRISQDPIYLFMVAFWLILATSLIFSRENLLGAYGLLKITGYLVIFAYIRENLEFSTSFSSPPDQGGESKRGFSHENNTKRPKFTIILWIIVISACLQSILGIYQYLSQSSIGLTFFGEEFLGPGLKGVAKFITHGTANPLLFDFFPNLSVISDSLVNMRAYGTFPHPNVLAVFLFLGLMANLYLLYFSPARKVLLGVSLIVLSTGLVITFSRLAWGISFLGILVFMAVVFLKHRPERFRPPAAHLYFPARVAFIASGLLVSLGLNLFLFSAQIKDRLTSQEITNIEASENYVDRKIYSNTAWNMFKANPVFGVGLRNFVVEMDNHQEGERLLPHQHQPVHNVYLLIAAESGILALLIFVLILLNIVRLALRNKKSPAREILFIIFFGFLVLGFFDHYFISIQQGSLMFWLVAGILAAK